MSLCGLLCVVVEDWLSEFVFCGMSSGCLAWLAYGESASCALLV